jgi:hypothetical protein
MNELVASLLIWIGAHSAFDVTGIAPPTLIETSSIEITRLTHRLAGRPGPSAADERLMGLYDPNAGPNGTIYVLSAALAPGASRHEDPLRNPYFQERVLHELVHHVQHRTGAIEELPCPAAAEHDAYRLAGMFLQHQRVADSTPNRRSLIRILGRC